MLTTQLDPEPQWCAEVRLRAWRRMLWMRALWAEHRYPDEESLAISHSEVELALADPRVLLAMEQDFYTVSEPARALSAELEALAAAPDRSWQKLCAELELSVGERHLLALALSAELCPALRRAYAYLQDVTVPIDPSPALVAELWQWRVAPQIGRASALTRWVLAQPADPSAELSSSRTGWVADPLLLDSLLPMAEPAADSGAAAGGPPFADGPELYEAELRDIASFVGALGSDLQIEIELTAPPGAGATALAERLASRLELPVLFIDGRAVAADADPAAAAARAARRARLAGALAVWEHAGQLPEGAHDAGPSRLPLSILVSEEPLPPPRGSTVRRSYAVPLLTRSQRLRLWSALADGPAPEPVAEWALHPGEIERVAAVAAAGDAAMHDVGRGLLLQVPHEHLTRLPVPYTWEDFVVAPALAAHLREFEAQATGRGEVLDDWGLARLTPLGRGVTALFSGPSGTGKTMAAQVLARSLSLDLYRIDLAGVVNKYIGETEKHLRAVFAACERAPVMLFFDEADALFGRRTQVSDAHDRYANIEVDYLLTRMEQFDGVAVLATNRKGDLDPAFLRRLRFTIDFLPPTEAERERLWRISLEAAVDSAGNSLIGAVDWEQLAREVDLNGAAIKSAALGAAFLARSQGGRIETAHLLAAARRELEKQGIVVRGQLQAA